MGRRLKNINLVLEESDNSPETSAESPRAPVSTSSSSNRSRRSVQKRVVSVPIKDVQRLSAPPPDSWAWRKYGQKPIKGSPYPRGYYRCSSSKGCPARKQVERSKADPDKIMVTYSCEHNHPSPPASSRSNLHRTSVAKSAADSLSEDELEEEEGEEVDDEELEEQDGELEMEKNPSDSIACKSEEISRSDEKLNSLVDGTLIYGGEFGWFDDLGDSLLFENPILIEEGRIGGDSNELGMVFPMGEEDESLFADLGELPECSTVFRRGMAAEQRRRSLATSNG